MTPPKLKGLGRGLDALLSANRDEEAARGELCQLPLEELRPGKYQPRTRMAPGSLEELAASIKTQGVMQPILVRPLNGASAMNSLTAAPLSFPAGLSSTIRFPRWMEYCLPSRGSSDRTRRCA